jgi:hypothetical protein
MTNIFTESEAINLVNRRGRSLIAGIARSSRSPEKFRTRKSGCGSSQAKSNDHGVDKGIAPEFFGEIWQSSQGGFMR